MRSVLAAVSSTYVQVICYSFVSKPVNGVYMRANTGKNAIVGSEPQRILNICANVERQRPGPDCLSFLQNLVEPRCKSRRARKLAVYEKNEPFAP